jgi:hypothetical protein
MAPHKSRGASAALHNELKRGSAELLILRLLEERGAMATRSAS